MNPGKGKYLVMYALWWLTGYSAAQCNADFTYSAGPQSLYQFNIISSPPATSATDITWYIRGPLIADRLHDMAPAYYLPVNGTYYVTLELTFANCSDYKIDTIIVSGLSPTGTCQADFDYYPTYGSQFQFTDRSVASDSIISHYWYGHTEDTFIQISGQGMEHPVMSLWAYNDCIYAEYYVSHAVTTISGCQSIKQDTISAYCNACLSGLEARMNVGYEPLSNTFSFQDVSVNGAGAGRWYWEFRSPDTILYSTAQNPVIPNPSPPLVVACVNVYDTAVHCVSARCDSLPLMLSVSSRLPEEREESFEIFQHSDRSLTTRSNVKGDLLFRIFDLVGKLVFETRVVNDGHVFELECLVEAPGVYIATLQQKGEAPLCKKVLVK